METLTADQHRQFHWAAIRTVCRSTKLGPQERRAKLRYFVDGLARSNAMRAVDSATGS